VPETLTCRFARAEEIPVAARLAAHSFPAAGRSAAAWEQLLREPAWGGGADTLLVGELHGRLVAAAQLHPLRQWIAGASLPVAGVGTVAVSLTHRRRGLAGQLMAAAFREARGRGDVASALYPFRAGFYHSLGYGAAGEVLQYQVPTAAFPASEERRRVEALEGSAAEREASRLYAAWARTQTGQLERTDAAWRETLGVGQRALFGYRSATGELSGYALVGYRADLSRLDRFLEVDELVWTTPAARAGLLGWLATLGDQWPQVLVRALPSQRLGDCLSEVRLPLTSTPAWRLWYPAATLLHGPMFRLLDVRGAWEGRRVAAGASLTIGLELRDSQLPENGGSWRLVLDAGRATIDRGGDVQLRLRLDVSALSRLFMNSISPTAALEAGLLDCDRPELLPLLDPLLTLPQPCTFDRF